MKKILVYLGTGIVASLPLCLSVIITVPITAMHIINKRTKKSISTK